MFKIKRSDKKGQYFLIAAIIVVVMLFAMAGITNKLIKRSGDETYDLKKELKLESVSVVNYGTIHTDELQGKLEDFVKQYGKYSGEGREAYFIFGNGNEVQIYFYNPNEDSGSISLDGTNIALIHESITIEPTQITSSDGKFKVEVKGYTYEFELKEGENFFFILQEDKTEDIS
ncbi:MAG TPA: hypothetical protein P5277_02415 [Candidatus Paceibacterota bacterium]|nr:hypothetical protein [Candidatus Paceibacterota bacterium]